MKLDKLVLIKIIESLETHHDQRHLVYALMQVNKDFNSVLRNCLGYLKSKWRRWYTRLKGGIGVDVNGLGGLSCYYVYQGMSPSYFDGTFLMFEHNINSVDPMVAGEFTDGEESGEWRQYFHDGELSHIDNYIKGVKVGKQLAFSKDGAILYENNYDADGKPHGRQYQNDIVETTTHFVHGIKHGRHTVVNNLGIIVKECTYVNGVEDGLHIMRYNSGEMKLTSFWANGKKNGLEVEYYEDGQKMRESLFVDDVEIDGQKLWWPNGQLASVDSYNGDYREIKEYTQDGVLKRTHKRLARPTAPLAEVPPGTEDSA